MTSAKRHTGGDLRFGGECLAANRMGLDGLCEPDHCSGGETVTPITLDQFLILPGGDAGDFRNYKGLVPVALIWL